MIEKRARANGKTSYRVRVKYRGRTLTATHVDRRTAERWAAEKGAEIRNEVHFAGESNRNRLLAALIDRYLEHVVQKKRDPRNGKRQLLWWRERLGDMKVREVTRAVITQCREELGAPVSGKVTRGPATVTRYLAALSHVFTVAINDWEWAEHNPVRGVRRPREPRGRDRYLSAEERTALLAACRASTSKDLYPFVLLALCTGMRRGEIATLEWRDIDLQRAQITLRTSKNGERRGIPLSGQAFEVLKEREKTKRADTPLVFPGRTSTQPVDLTKPWETARRRAGLTDFRFHDLRHSFASSMAMTGSTSLEIAAVLGHKTLQMTKRYAHHSVGSLKGAIERATAGVLHHE